jgi:hypothetical protein
MIVENRLTNQFLNGDSGLDGFYGLESSPIVRWFTTVGPAVSESVEINVPYIDGHDGSISKRDANPLPNVLSQDTLDFLTIHSDIQSG